jgi:thiol-disulfide isomerase/thioredoxin
MHMAALCLLVQPVTAERKRAVFFSHRRAIAILLGFGILAASLPTGAAKVSEEWWLEEEGLSATGGSSVVLRQATATWCDVCRVADPVIIDFSKSKGANIVRIAIHPQDGIDPLGTSMSTRQAWLLSDAPPSELVYPTSWFDTADGLSGQLSDNELQREMLRAQGSRATESLSMNIARISEPGLADSHYLDFEVTGFSSGGTLSLFITEDSVDIGDSAENMNGVQFHDDVLRAGFTVNATEEELDWEDRLIFQEPSVGVGTRTWGYNHETSVRNLGLEIWLNPEWIIGNLNFILIHESEEGSILSAMALPGDWSSEPDELLTTSLVIGVLALGGVLMATPAVWSRKASAKSSEKQLGAESEE